MSPTLGQAQCWVPGRQAEGPSAFLAVGSDLEEEGVWLDSHDESHQPGKVF